MLKQVITACPPEEAPQIVEKVIREWDAFTRALRRAKAGRFQHPGDQPTIEFLLKYVGFAVSFAVFPESPAGGSRVRCRRKLSRCNQLQSWKKPSLAQPRCPQAWKKRWPFKNDDTDAS